MKQQNVTKLASRLVITLCLFVFTLSAQAAIYLKLGDIKGESTARDYPEWIDVLSVSEGLSIAIDTSGTTRERSVPSFQDVNVAKYLDKASPQIRLSVAQGTHIPEAEIVITKNTDGREVVVFKIVMKQVIVSSVSMSSGSGEVRPSENITLNFSEVQWTYTERDERGGKTGDIQADWNLEKNTKI